MAKNNPNRSPYEGAGLLIGLVTTLLSAAATALVVKARRNKGATQDEDDAQD